MVDEKKDKTIDVNVDENEESDKSCDCGGHSEETADEDPEYNVYGKETEEETKSMAEKMFKEVVSTLKTKQDGWNKTITDYKTNKPSVDLFDYNDYYVIKVDLPRLAKEDISLKMSSNALEIISEFPDELSDDEEVTVLKKERCYGKTKNSILLPSEVDLSNVKATFKEGLLTINLPKLQSSKVDVEIE